MWIVKDDIKREKGLFTVGNGLRTILPIYFERAFQTMNSVSPSLDKMASNEQ